MRYVSLDIETHDPFLTDNGKQKARGASWVYGEGQILVVGLYNGKHKKAIDGNGGETVRNFLLSEDIAIIGANIQYDIGWLLYEHNINAYDMKCSLIDVSIAESMIDEYQPYSLDALAQKYLGEKKQKDVLEQIAVSHGLKGDFRKHLLELWELGYKEEIRNYVISDADQPWRIWQQQKEILTNEGTFNAFDINMKMASVAVGMKQRGVRIDYKKWVNNCGIASKAYDELREEYNSKYGEVNINSPKQLAKQFDRFDVPYKYKIVFKGWKQQGVRFKNALHKFSGDYIWEQRNQLKNIFPGVLVEKGDIILRVPKKYAERTRQQAENLGYEVSCNPSINKYLYEELKDTHQIIADLVQYKQAKNIIDKFLGPAFGRFIVYHGDGEYRIHGDFNVVGARQTSRMSGSHPNLQQCPSKTVLFDKTERRIDLAYLCREVFIAEKGCAFVKFDYDAQENRIIAHFAPGKTGEQIREMYRKNPALDEHDYVTSVSGLGEEYGKKQGRKYAKNIRFGVSYGMQIARLMIQFGWDKEFAEWLYDKVMSAAPWLADYMTAVQEVAKKRRWVRTLLGRRIHLRQGRDRDAYKVTNWLTQGSAADMTKAATVKMHLTRTIEDLLLSIHDEGDLSVRTTKQGIKRVLELQECMQTAVSMSVPITSYPDIGTNWANGVSYGRELGTVEEFVTEAFKAIKERRFDQWSETVKQYRDLDDDTETFAQFCSRMDVLDEEEETA